MPGAELIRTEMALGFPKMMKYEVREMKDRVGESVRHRKDRDDANGKRIDCVVQVIRVH